MGGRQYTHIVIDTPARPTADELADLAEGCDLLIVPTTPDALALDALMRMLQTLRALPGTRSMRMGIWYAVAKTWAGHQTPSNWRRRFINSQATTMGESSQH